MSVLCQYIAISIFHILLIISGIMIKLCRMSVISYFFDNINSNIHVK